VDAWPSKLSASSLGERKVNQCKNFLFSILCTKRIVNPLPLWLAEIFYAMCTSSPRTRRPLMFFFSIHEYANGCFQLPYISNIKERTKSNWAFTFIAHLFLWGSAHTSFEVFSTLLIELSVHFDVTRELTECWV